ncbi:exonuclease domain-containing protein [Paludibacterium yongneupense]|uniref:exonuclease domain-containing protein n=1 Tax=Paludibacterium yongneupense TaxID=400061 RepID=UPI0004038742|nr:exonuclease domain-containing protein [Paludibacterium yongneupense]
MLFDRPLAIVDLETTGGHIVRDRITEIGVIFIDGARVERFSTLINPGQPIPPFIEHMTGISDAMVASAPAFADVAADLLERLQGRLFIAHNVRFDYGFLKNAFKRLGLRFQCDALCTVKLSRRLYPQFYKHNLDSLIERHGLVLADRHRALADAEALRLFLDSARTGLGAAALEAAAAEVLAQQTVPPGVDSELVDALPDVPGVFMLHGEGNEVLYVERADNLRQQVLAHFSSASPQDRVLRVDWHETIGEFGARLLELRLQREHKPRLNPRARLAECCSIQLEAGEGGLLRPRIVTPEEIDFSRTDSLFGLFRGAREARKVLQEMARAAGLCQSVLGVEQVTSRKGEACHGHRGGYCRGACIGRESAESHNARLRKALERVKVKAWPFAGAIEIEECDEVSGETATHVFDRWCYLGSRRGGEAAAAGNPLFDSDIYRLLSGYLRKPTPASILREAGAA